MRAGSNRVEPSATVPPPWRTRTQPGSHAHKKSYLLLNLRKNPTWIPVDETTMVFAGLTLYFTDMSPPVVLSLDQTNTEHSIYGGSSFTGK